MYTATDFFILKMLYSHHILFLSGSPEIISNIDTRSPIDLQQESHLNFVLYISHQHLIRIHPDRQPQPPSYYELNDPLLEVNLDFIFSDLASTIDRA